MAQQVSVEAALPVFRQRCSELHDENLLLRAQVAELKRRVTELEDAAQQTTPDETEHVTPGPAHPGEAAV